MALDGCSIGNIPFYPWLPMGVTNFGGDTQVFTIEPWNSAPIGMSLNNQGLLAVNGDSIPLINNWGYLNPVPADSVFNNPNNNLAVQIPQPNPFEIMMQNTVKQMSANFITQDLNIIKSNLNSMKQNLNSKLAQSTYSDDQIAKINDLLDQIAEKETELTNFMENEMPEMETSDVQARINEFNNDIRTINTEIRDIGSPENA